MKYKKIRVLCVGLLFCFVYLPAFSAPIIITTNSGEKIKGDAIEVTHEFIKIKSQDGEIFTIDKKNVSQIDDPNEKIPEPMAGIIAKTPIQEKANQDFINHALKEKGTKEEAAKAAVELGWKYYDSGDLVTAMKRFNQAWLLDSQNADAYWGFGLILLEQNRIDKAIELFNKSISINPTNKDVYLNRGHAYGEKKDFDKAIEDYTAAIKIDPNDGQFYNDRAVAYFYSEQYEKSWQDVKKAKSIGYAVHPGFLKALEEKGYKN